MHHKNDQGSILVMALVLVAIMLLLGVALINAGSDELKIAANELRASKAFNLAEAGGQHAIRRMKDSPSSPEWDSGNVRLGDGQYHVAVTKSNTAPNAYVIKSEGWLGDRSQPTAYRAIQMSVIAKSGLQQWPYFIGANSFNPDLQNHALVIGNIVVNNSVSRISLDAQSTMTGDIYVNGNVGTIYIGSQVTFSGSIYVNGDVGTIDFQNDNTTFTGNIKVKGKVSSIDKKVPDGIVLVGVQVPTPPVIPNYSADYWNTLPHTLHTGSILDFSGLPGGLPDGSTLYQPSSENGGSLTIQGVVHGSHNVTVIASGTLTINSLSYGDKAADGPITLVGVKGISVGKGADIVGLLYTPGTVTFPGQGNTNTHFGAIIAETIDYNDKHIETTFDNRLATQGIPGTGNGLTTIDITGWDESYQRTY